MVALVGRQGISGDGAYWTVTQAGDPDVLTMVFPEQVATDATVPDVSLPRGPRRGSLGNRLRRRESTHASRDFLTLPRVGQGPGQRNAHRGGIIGALRHYAGDGRVGITTIQ